MKNVVVIGATGVIGIALIKQLLKADANITVITRPNSSRLVYLPKDERIKFVYAQLDEIGQLKEEDIGHPDCYYYLSWDGAADARNDAYRQFQNVSYMMETLKLVERTGGRFVGIGSQAEYGMYDDRVAPNEVCNPVSAYGMAKLFAQKMCGLYAEQKSIPFIWARVFSVYGPHDLDKTLLMSCIKSLREDKDFEMTKCETEWDYIYATDAAKALYLIGKSGKDKSIYNICSGSNKPLKEYVLKLQDELQKRYMLQGHILLGARPSSSSQPHFMGGDITNLVEDTGFKPEYDFTAGIRETIDWCMENENEN